MLIPNEETQTYTWVCPDHDEYKDIPEWIKEELTSYINFGDEWIEDVLVAMLENNWVDAVCKSDSNTIKFHKQIALLLYNYVPCGARGSKLAVDKWISHSGFKGQKYD